jgi:5'-phosphate synthase pdxT subunit
MTTRKRIGVLAMQGGFAEHIVILRKLGVEAEAIRDPSQLRNLDGLIIPGGESTAIGRLMACYGLVQPLKEMAREGFPLFGTCAGMILLAKQVIGASVDGIGAMDIKVKRNAFGRQVDSFESLVPITVLGEPPFPAVFIRAPIILEAGAEVQVLARLESGTAVAARQVNLLVSAFHPELTSDLRFHAYFLKIVSREV